MLKLTKVNNRKTKEEILQQSLWGNFNTVYITKIKIVNRQRYC